MNQLSTNTITVQKIDHRGNFHIGLFFEYNTSIIEKVKSLFGRRYSKSKNCWYLPYTKDSFLAFKRLNIPHTINIGTTDLSLINSDNADISPIKEAFLVPPVKKTIQDANINVRWNNDRFILRMTYNDKDVAFVKKMKGSYWNRYEKAWVIRGTVENLDKINQYFGCYSLEKYTKILVA